MLLIYIIYIYIYIYKKKELSGKCRWASLPLLVFCKLLNICFLLMYGSFGFDLLKKDYNSIIIQLYVCGVCVRVCVSVNACVSMAHSYQT